MQVYNCKIESKKDNIVDANYQVEKDIEMYINLWDVFIYNRDSPCLEFEFPLCDNLKEKPMRNKNKKNTQPPRLMTKIITVHSAKQETMTAHHRLHQLHRSGPTKVLQTNHFESTVIMSTV